MKKYISVLFLLAFIIPSVALASWWNPFSWKIFQKKDVVPNPQVEIQKTPEEKINELQKQLDELKNQQKPEEIPTQQVINKQNIESSKTKIEQPKMVVDVCSNITGIQSQSPEGYSSSGGICTQLKDLCPNINGIQSKVPDGMFIYGDDRNCFTQNEINYIANKIAEQKNEEIESQKYSDPVFSQECEDANNNLRRIESRINKIENLSDRATATVNEIYPAQSEVRIACGLGISTQKLEPTKSTHCYVNYYGDTASVSCYEN